MSVPETVAAAAEVPESSWARRVARPRWRDPRLLLGVLLVLVCVLGGARLLSTADDYVEVWSASHDLSAGSALEAEDLQVRRVRFADQADADRYVSAEVAPLGVVLARAMGAGELLPRAALQGSAQPALAELPLAVAEASVPTDLARGDVVDVWVVPDEDLTTTLTPADGRRSAIAPVLAERVLPGVVVLSTGDGAVPLGGGGIRTIVVGVGAEEAQRLPSMLPALSAGEVVIVRMGG